MKNISKFLLLFLVIGGLFALSSFLYFQKQPKRETIKFVLSSPMRGPAAGKGMDRAIRLALEEANYQAGLFDIVFEAKDNGNEAGDWIKNVEESNAKSAILDKDVMVYFGPSDSGAAKVSIPITNSAGIAQISPSNTWPGLTQPGFAPGEPGIFYPTGIRNYFRAVPTDALQAPAGAVWARDLGAKRIAILDDGDVYGTGIANLFEKQAKELGLQVVSRKTIDKTASDLLSDVKLIDKNKADLIYYGGTIANGAYKIASAIKQVNPKIKFMAPDSVLEQAFIRLSEGNAEGAYLTSIGLPTESLTSGKGKEFVDKYKNKYGVQPDIFGVYAYESAKIALEAIQRAGVKDRSRIREEIAKTKDYEGIFGKWSFDQNGDTTLQLVSGSIVEGGMFSFSKVLPVK